MASDEHLKKSIAPLAIGERPGIHLGMVAQEVERVFPGWVDTGADGYKRLTFRGFEAVTVEAVRELNTQIELERQNAELRRTLAALADQVAALQLR